MFIAFGTLRVRLSCVSCFSELQNFSASCNIVCATLSIFSMQQVIKSESLFKWHEKRKNNRKKIPGKLYCSFSNSKTDLSFGSFNQISNPCKLLIVCFGHNSPVLLLINYNNYMRAVHGLHVYHLVLVGIVMKL